MVILKIAAKENALSLLTRVLPDIERFDKKTGIPSVGKVYFSIDDIITDPESIKTDEFQIGLRSYFFRINIKENSDTVFTANVGKDKNTIVLKDFKKAYDFYGHPMKEPLNSDETERITAWLKEKFAPYAERIGI